MRRHGDIWGEWPRTFSGELEPTSDSSLDGSFKERKLEPISSRSRVARPLNFFSKLEPIFDWSRGDGPGERTSPNSSSGSVICGALIVSWSWKLATSDKVISTGPPFSVLDSFKLRFSRLRRRRFDSLTSVKQNLFLRWFRLCKMPLCSLFRPVVTPSSSAFNERLSPLCLAYGNSEIFFEYS